MKIILTEKVPTLGNVGEIVNVSVGHARNYLFPNKLAVVADESNKKQLENHKKSLMKKVKAERDEALAIKKKLDSLHLDLVKRVGSNGKLFGSVTTTELSQILAEKGITVEKRVLTVDTPIKALGNYKVKAKLFTDVDANFTVKIILDPTQAEELKKQEAEAIAAKKKMAEDEKLKKEAKEAEGNAAAEMTEEQRLKAEADKLLRG